MILKVLLVGVVIAIVYFMFIKKKPLSDTTTHRDKKTKADDMVECSECGVYAPLNESILSNGNYFCSEECLKKER